MVRKIDKRCYLGKTLQIFKEDLSYADGLLLKSFSVVVAKSLKKDIINPLTGSKIKHYCCKSSQHISLNRRSKQEDYFHFFLSKMLRYFTLPIWPLTSQRGARVSWWALSWGFSKSWKISDNAFPLWERLGQFCI